MKKICAVFALLLLFIITCIPVHADTGSVRVIDVKGNDITADNHEEGDSDDKPRPSDDDDGESAKTEEVSEEDESKIFKALRTVGTGAIEDFVYKIIDQLMEGSVSIFETEVDENTENETLSYTINTKHIDPYAPSFVREVQLPTGGFYIVGIFFTILGSGLIRLIYEKYPVQFSEFREALTGEEKPYNNESIVFASVIAMVLWIAYLLLVYLITGFRNLVIDTASSTSVILPDTYATNLPTFMLTAIASYSSAFQSATGEYGIYTFTAILFLAGIVSEILLLLGASGAFWKFNIIYWGLFTICCFIDIYIVCAISVGASLYIMEGNPIYMTVGLTVSVAGIIILCVLLLAYAVWKGRKIISGV